MKALFWGFPLTLLGAGCYVQSSASLPAPSLKSTPPPINIEGFRKWYRATESPFQISDWIATRCAAAPGDLDFYERIRKEPPEIDKFPHRGYVVHVYVNDIGKPSMVLDGKPFPQGSIVVKEKFPNSGDYDGRSSHRQLSMKSGTVLTVMRKREKGFAPDTGDWEYFTGDPKSLKLTTPAPKQLKDCMFCHSQYQDRDYITKAYLVSYESYWKFAEARYRESQQPSESSPQPH